MSNRVNQEIEARMTNIGNNILYKHDWLIFWLLYFKFSAPFPILDDSECEVPSTLQWLDLLYYFIQQLAIRNVDT